jgi:hypothetical protein
MDDLADGVHPAVGAARADGSDRMPGHEGKRVLHGVLNRRRMDL